MPRASGTMSLVAGNPVISGSVISSVVQNNTMNDIANEITNSIPRDGSAPPTANMPMGNFKITGLGAATLATDVPQYQQIQSGATNYLTSVSGTNTIVATLATPTLTSYVAGQPYRFVSTGTNTGATTVNINAIGAKTIQKNGVALSAGDITSGQTYELIYDGANMQLFGSATTAGVTSTQLQNQTYTSFTTGGTSSAFTLTPTPAIAANAANQSFFVKFNAAPTGSPTLAVSGQTALNLKYYDSTGTKQFVTSAQAPINWQGRVLEDGTDWVLLDILPPVSNILSKLGSFAASVATNALTATLNPFTADFRNSTLSNGVPNTRTLAASASVVAPAGATFGAPAAITSASATMAGTTTLTLVSAPSAPVQIGAIIFQAGARIGKVVSLGTYVGGVGTGTVILDASATFTTQAIVIINPARLLLLAIDNAGTIEPALVNQSGGVKLDETGLISTTAIGAGSTANNVVYSTTSRTNVPYKVMGFIDIAQPTVGTYTLAPELVFGASGSSLAAMWSLGNGQITQDVTSQRVFGQTYRNIEGRPITVYLAFSAINNTTVTANGVGYGLCINASKEAYVVQPGNTISITGTSATFLWIESK